MLVPLLLFRTIFNINEMDKQLVLEAFKSDITINTEEAYQGPPGRRRP